MSVSSVVVLRMPNLITITGPPGVGKTRTIIASKPQCVVTYTKDAAAEVTSRMNIDPMKAGTAQCGTIYSLSWPHVKAQQKLNIWRHDPGQNTPHQERRIRSSMDPALDSYEATAPSRYPKHILEPTAFDIHAWRDGGSHLNLKALNPRGPLKFCLPLARWVAAGCPWAADFEGYDEVVVDEAQDMSGLELAAALGLCKPDGVVRAYGDPGQAIFLGQKGIKGNELPAAWVQADEIQTLHGGWRVGAPVSEMASGVLSSYYDIPPETFTAKHATTVHPWDFDSQPHGCGLVLGHSRASVAAALRSWGAIGTAVVPSVGDPDKELVMCTGHAAKGAEADNVYLLPWSAQGMRYLEMKEAARLRLLYVMMTRAKRRLFVPHTLLAMVRRMTP